MGVVRSQDTRPQAPVILPSCPGRVYYVQPSTNNSEANWYISQYSRNASATVQMSPPN